MNKTGLNFRQKDHKLEQILMLIALFMFVFLPRVDAQNRDVFTSLESRTGCNTGSGMMTPVTINGLNSANQIYLKISHIGLDYAGSQNQNPVFAGNPLILNDVNDTLLISWDGNTETIDLLNDTLIELLFSPTSAGSFDLKWTPACEYLDINGDELESDYDDAVFTITSGPDITTVETTDILCNEGNTGSISIMATDAATYSIDSGLSWHENNGLFTELMSGDYYIQAKDDNGCITSWPDNPVIVNEAAALIIDTVVFTNVSGCFGNENASITITSSGGTGMVFYSIDNGENWFVNAGNFSELAAGSYTIVVKDINDCHTYWANNPLIIAQPDEIIIDTVLTSNVSGCSTNNNGSLNITAFGGSSDLLYSIDSSLTWQDTSFFDQLIAGDYYIFAKDANDCINAYIHNPVSIDAPDPIVVDTVFSFSPGCPGQSDGSLEISAFGGSGNLHYSIDSGQTYFENAGIFSNLSATTYYVFVRDDSLCLGEYAFNPVLVSDPDPIMIDSLSASNPSCFNSMDGFIDIYAIGGTDTLFYSIDSGANWTTEQLFTNLSPGVYYTAVKDVNDCQHFYTANPVVLTNPDSLFITDVIGTNPACYNTATGSLTILAGGGTLPLYYSIDSGATYQDTSWFDQLMAGEYQIIVKDANDCQLAWVNNPLILTQADSLLFNSVQVQNISCGGMNDGSIDIFVAGGTPNYEYSIDDGANWSNSPSFSNLTAGSYVLRIKDALSCESAYENNPVVITEPEAIIINDVYKRDISCIGGSIFISAEGGTEPLMYSIDYGVNWIEDTAFTDLQEAGYYIKVKDQNGCIAEWDQNPVLIETMDTLTLDLLGFTEPLCYGGDEASILVQGNGGAGNLFYSIDFGTTWQDTGYFEHIDGGGMYYLLVIDENGCVADWGNNPLEINEPEEILITEFSKTDNKCFGDTLGEISVSVIGGSGFFNYSIDSGMTWQGYSQFTGLTAGSYALLIKDSDGCGIGYAGNPVEIIQPDQIMIDSINVYDISCPTCSDAIIQIFARGGDGALRYSINNGNNWSSNPVFTSLSAGEYYISITDAKDCFVLYEENPVLIGTITGMEDLTEARMKIYPNPAKDYIIVENQGDNAKTMRISSATGQILISEQITNAKQRIDVSMLSRGLYFIEISGNNARTKFIIQ